MARDAHILPPAMVSPDRNSESPETLQDYLQRECAKQGINHEGIAERAVDAGHKLSASYVNNMMNGTAGNPTGKVILALAAGLRKKDPAEVFRAAYGLPQPEAEGLPNDLFYSLASDYELLSEDEQRLFAHHLEIIRLGMIRSIQSRRKKL